MSKKTLVIALLGMLTTIILLIAIVLFSINNQEEQLQENMKKINSNYAGFSTNITDNDAIKKDLIEKLENYSIDTFEDELGDYDRILKKYDKNIKYLDSLVEDMEKRCKHKYEDVNTQMLCKGYAGLYETTVNKYIVNVKKYNEKVEEYNQNKNKNIKTHEMVHNDYIDYDKDGKYKGSN